MKIRLWKGHHSADLQQLVQQAWRLEQLLVLCPPLLQDFSFAACLPFGEFEFHGDFSETEKQQIENQTRKPTPWPQIPVFGIFTSGTISRTPRLVFYSKANVLASLQSILSVFETSQIKKVYSFPQPFHTFGLTLGYLVPEILQVPLITPIGKYSAASLEQWLQIQEPGLFTLGTPTHFHDLTQKVLLEKRTVHPSHSCIAGGAPVSVGLWNQMRSVLGIQFPSIGYGCTEAAPGLTHLPPGHPPTEDSEIGFPLPTWQIETVPEQGIQISGPGLCMGFIQNAEQHLLTQALIRDRIRVRPDQVWVFEGRTDLMLNRGGAKFPLEKIESMLLKELGWVTIATALPDPRLGHDLGLAVLNPQQEAVSILTLNQKLKQHCGFELKAKNFLQLKQLPLNESAKLDRQGIHQQMLRQK